MPSIDQIVIEAEDPTAHGTFYTEAFGLGERVRVRAADKPTDGFRGFTLSLVVPRPSDVDAFTEAATAAGATPLKPPAKSLWGYGGVLRAPDGTIITIASATKKDAGPSDRTIDELVLQLGVEDVAASKQFYADRGLTAAGGFGRKYVTFDTGPFTLALYQRRALAKTAGVPPEGSGSHRLALVGDAGSFNDPDGFVWEQATAV